MTLPGDFEDQNHIVEGDKYAAEIILTSDGRVNTLPYDAFLNLHAHIPGAPDDGTQIAHLVGIADDVDILCLGSQGSGTVAHGQDHAVSGDLEGGAVLAGSDRNAPYTVKELDGSFTENEYTIPQLQIRRKEEKK